MQINGNSCSTMAASEPPEPPPRNPDKINASLKQISSEANPLCGQERTAGEQVKVYQRQNVAPFAALKNRVQGRLRTLMRPRVSPKIMQ
uniref:Uncharacterized protein n=1 Tax=Lutzomyia longipalpis TaxID=7200 RepID=A0A1B0CGN4_LUTLO